jgi:hypothetical protein
MSTGFGYTSVFKKVLDEATVDKVAPKVKQSAMTEEAVTKVLELLCKSLELELVPVLAGVCLLFLKGAASDGSPLSLSVEVMGRDITKKDLIYCYEMVTGNKYLRRMAEAMAVSISQYAEKNGLYGDLGKRILTRHRAATGETLTPKELAWCSSFCQDLPDLATFASERVVKLLAEDYDSRFSKKPKVKENKAAKTASKAKGKSQPQAKNSKDKDPAKSSPKAEAQNDAGIDPPQAKAKRGKNTNKEIK